MAPQLYAASSPHLALFGLPLSATGIANLLLKGLTGWVALGSARVVDALGHALDVTTAVPLGRTGAPVFQLVGAVGALACLPILALATLQAIGQQDLGQLLRTALVRLPLAFLLAGAAVELVSLGLRATDELSGALLSTAGGPNGGVIGQLARDLGSVEPPGVVGAGFEGLFLAVVAAAVGFALWVELVVRSAAVAVATLFVPLALAGLCWPATAHWARRLAETLAGLVLSKLVIAGVLALAGASIAPGGGLSGIVEAIALLVLAVFAPFSLLRLVPMVEAGATASLEGLGARARRNASHAAREAVGLDFDPPSGPSAGDGLLALGSEIDPVSLDALAREIETTLLVHDDEVGPGEPGDARREAGDGR